MTLKTGIYDHVGFSQFCDAFRDMDRQDQFTYEGKRALYDYLDDLSQDIGEPIELDVIALCCDFTEYESLEKFQAEYSKDYESIDDISNDTTVIRIDNEAFIIQAF